MRQNRESSYALLLLVLTLPVVRGSCFSTGVSAVISTAKCTKTAKSFMIYFYVRVVRVVRGSCFKTDCNANRERREKREQKRECPQ